MSGFLTHALHQTCFVLRKSPLTESLVLPPELTSHHVAGDVELLQFASQGFGNAERVILVLADHDFISTINMLREKVAVDPNRHLGVVVVSKVPANLLKERHAFPELVDVVLDKALEEAPELHLLRAVRHMVRVEEIKKPRLGHQTLLKLNEHFFANPDLSKIMQKSRILQLSNFFFLKPHGPIDARLTVGCGPS